MSLIDYNDYGLGAGLEMLWGTIMIPCKSLTFILFLPRLHFQDPVQEWADEVEENIVYGVTLRRKPVQSPTEAAEEQPVFGCVQYRTHKVRRVKAATLDRLVEQLLNPECQDPDYNHIFLSTYRAFTSSSALIELLFQR